MKIFTAGDLHADQKLADAVVEEANSGKYNAFIGLGDYEKASFYEKFQERLEVTNISCTGNWDFNFNPPANNEYSMLYNYAKVDLDDYKVILLGSVYPSPAQLVQELKKFIGDTPREKVIFASHYPPYMCCDMSRMGNHGGQPEFKDLILRFKPALWLCCHIHEAAGIQKYQNTVVINASIADTPEAYSVTLGSEGVKKITTVNMNTGEETGKSLENLGQ